MIGWQPSTMPTTILMTTVNTLLSIATIAMGIFSPYCDAPPYFTSMMLHTSEMMTIDICVIKEESPSLIASPNDLKCGIKLFKVSLKVFERNR